MQKSLSTKSKVVKHSSKGQITIPKVFLDQMGLSKGQDILILFTDNHLEISNQQAKRKQRLNQFIPTTLNTSTVHFSDTHNDTYDPKNTL
jgi:bifunctional DNA-binding transcriptional regulator/antitoxin component of YhaV-PrlF toxin-antitoxin module